MATRQPRNRTAPIDPDSAGGDTDAELAGRTNARAKRRSESASNGRSGGGSSGGSGGGRSVVQSGWAAYRTTKAATSKWNSKDEFKIGELLPAKYYGKFLQDGPFAVYGQHFYKGRPDKKAFVCTTDCPLCAIDEEPTVYAVFNILDLNGAEPTVKYWRCTPSPASQIEEYEDEGLINALDRYFVAFKKESKSGYNEFTVNEVLDVKLMDKAGVEPFSEEELAAFDDQLFTEDDLVKAKVIVPSTRSELQQVVRELVGDDEDD